MFCIQSVSQSVRPVAKSCPTLCGPMDLSTPGLPVHHQILEFTQTHVHWVSDAIQQSHPLLSPSPAFNLSQNQGQGLFKWVSLLHSVSDHLSAFPASWHLPVLTGIPKRQDEAWGLVCGNSRDFLFLWLIASQPQPHRRGRSFMHMNAPTVCRYPAFAGSQLVDKLLNAKLQ